MDNIKSSTRKMALMSMLLAMITVLSALEHMLPPLPLLPPNVRLGLSNIVTMYSLLFLGAPAAISLCLLKSAFVVIMRGVTAGVLSLCGGLSSILLLILLIRMGRGSISYLMLSIAGAITHNLGQIIAASFLLSTNLVLPYLPVLLASGVLLGYITGCLLRIIMPYFHKIFKKN